MQGSVANDLRMTPLGSLFRRRRGPIRMDDGDLLPSANVVQNGRAAEVEGDDKLPGRALCMLHKRPPAVTIDGMLGERLPQDTIVEQRSLL